MRSPTSTLRRAPSRQAPVAPEAPQPVPAQEPVRRRSTVREPAPIAGGENAPAAPAAATPPASPAAEPVVETTEAAEGDRPRRTGWWSRRFAGG